MTIDPKQEAVAGGESERCWLIRKGGYFYRTNRSGYTTDKHTAGRFTKEEADREACIEPWHMKAVHEQEVPDGLPPALDELTSLRAEVKTLMQERDEARAQSGVRVKPLEWRNLGLGSLQRDAEGCVRYYAWTVSGLWFWQAGRGLPIRCASEAEAVAAAQADHERRVLAQLEPAAASPTAIPIPDDLHPATRSLVVGFATALAAKLRKSEIKYGYSDDWARNDWLADCREHLRAHVEKGDPLDVAAYCAFMWFHGWSTAAAALPPPKRKLEWRQVEDGHWRARPYAIRFVKTFGDWRLTFDGQLLSTHSSREAAQAAAQAHADREGE